MLAQDKTGLEAGQSYMKCKVKPPLTPYLSPILQRETHFIPFRSVYLCTNVYVLKYVLLVSVLYTSLFSLYTWIIFSHENIGIQSVLFVFV